MLRPLRAALGVLVAVGLSGCGESDASKTGEPGSKDSITAVPYEVAFDPSDFSTPVVIDNRFLPWGPEVSREYLKDENQTLDMQVNEEPITVMGIECLQVGSSLADENTVSLENRYGWYAQDDAGNVWCLGEDVWGPDGFDDARSWKAGVDGALPGIAMPAEANIGLTYRRGYSADHAEDWAQIIELDVDVPATRYLQGFSGCLTTKEWSALSPERVENKVYCPEVGMVTSEVVEGGTGFVELWNANQP